MTRVVYPTARLSANGAAALLDTVDHGLRVCDLPSSAVRWDLGEDQDITLPSLSASGNAVAWVAESGQVTILTDAGQTHLDLPAPRDCVRAVAVSDTGDRVAVLIAADAEDGTDGSLLVMGNGDVAKTEIPVHDNGFILANDDCSLLAVRSSSTIDEQRYSGAFVRNGDAFRPLWKEETVSQPHGVLALYGDWFVAATADGVAGWRRTGEQTTISGTMRERLIFAPDGSHLLAYRASEVIEVTSARMLFRLIELISHTEVRRTSHLIEDRGGAQFVVDGELDLFEVRATRAGELAVKELGWRDGTAASA
ncbi:MAG: hypothetical protein ACRDJH_21725 [Thermomicrobiales bacterium]